MKRVLLIGLDGVSPRLLELWRGQMPHLDRLMTGGTWGSLNSSIPPRSIPAWYCFATGMNPAKFGVYGFSQRRPDSYDYTFANMTYCRASTFWEWLNRHGITTAVMHVPGTFPPQPVAGLMVSGWPAPLNRGNLTYTYPVELSRDIDRFLGRQFEFDSDQEMRTDNDAEMLEERLRITRMHGDVAHHLLSTHPWQVGVVVLTATDRASHQFWRHMDTGHPAHDRELAQRFGDALKRVYVAADEEVGRLLSLLDEEDTVFVVSDHGFGPAHYIFYINEWLRREGYLVLREEANIGKVGWRTRVLGAVSKPLFWLNQSSPTFRRLVAPLKRRTLSRALRSEYVRAKGEGLVRVNHAPVDWTRTRAYVSDEASLYLNLKGRDPQGIVAPGPEAVALRAEIEAGLRAIPHPQTGDLLPVILHRKEDIYAGPFIEDAPDLIVAMGDYTIEVMAELGSPQLFVPSRSRSGTHTPQGILIAKGPDIQGGQQLDAEIVDIAPTLLHHCGLPIPEHSDGRVLFDLYREQSELRQREVEKAVDMEDRRHTTNFTEEEQVQVEQQLRNLGYLE